MQIWNGVKNADSQQKFQGGAVTFGNFDGLHLGHRALVEAAQRAGRPATVFTFDPHPMRVLHPERAVKSLFPRVDLIEQLEKMNVDLLVLQPFDAWFARVTASGFLDDYVIQPFQPKTIVVGHDCGFGRGREGTLDFLKAKADEKDIQVQVVDALTVGGVVASSGRIRDAVAAGDMERARMFLGRPFYLRGRPVAGDGRGEALGFPTLNQSVENETLPPHGVYVSSLRVGEKSYPSVTNIGINPTFATGTHLKVESFALSGKIPGTVERVDLDLLKRLRPEIKFASVEELKKQIERDILEAKHFHGL
jgi:riboflavin kinase/FMN adenylyltransferase